ncbi:MAG: S8 family serine peptidase, partial [Candidatus Aenigmatarchaeota archaeon]
MNKKGFALGVVLILFVSYLSLDPGSAQSDTDGISDSVQEPFDTSRVDKEIMQELSKYDEARIIIKFREEPKTFVMSQSDFWGRKTIDAYVAGNIKDITTINTLLLDADIAKIYLDKEMELFVTDSISVIRADMSSYGFPLTGSGQRVCVVDTGVDYKTVTNYLTGYDFVNNDADPMDDHGHGTEVAYIIQNVSPKASIIGVKVLNASGRGYGSDVMEGIAYCMTNGAHIISMSIGSGSYDGYCDRNPVAELSNKAVAQGIFVAVATGNDGTTNITSPSCAMNVTRVSATYKNDTIAEFSNVNIMVDLFAPGANVTTKTLGNKEVTRSGTSISTPMVAAAAALLLENESLAPLDVKYRFRSTGIPISFRQGMLTINISRLDVFNAITNNTTMIPYEYDVGQSEGDDEVFTPQANDGCASTGSGTTCSNDEGCCSSLDYACYITKEAAPEFGYACTNFADCDTDPSACGKC